MKIDKELAVESIQFRIRRVSGWRDLQADRWPDDPRNRRAAKKLEALSRADTGTVTAEQWAELEPLAETSAFNDLVDSAARAVEFRSKAATMREFADLILARSKDKSLAV